MDVVPIQVTNLRGEPQTFHVRTDPDTEMIRIDDVVEALHTSNFFQARFEPPQSLIQLYLDPTCEDTQEAVVLLTHDDSVEASEVSSETGKYRLRAVVEGPDRYPSLPPDDFWANEATWRSEDWLHAYFYHHVRSKFEARKFLLDYICALNWNRLPCPEVKPKEWMRVLVEHCEDAGRYREAIVPGSQGADVPEAPDAELCDGHFIRSLWVRSQTHHNDNLISSVCVREWILDDIQCMAKCGEVRLDMLRKTSLRAIRVALSLSYQLCTERVLQMV